MSPKALQYRTNSIIYFKGDASDRVFILNKGKVSLNYMDVETGQDIHDLIKVGEFFGVRSAMGLYRREETAIAVEPAAVIAFSIPEFEQLVSKNTRIIMKMLAVFSNQLRRIHKRVQALLTTDEQVSPETGLYRIGEYYFKTKNYNQAIYSFGRYMVYYPSGKFSDLASKNLQLAEENLSQYGQGQGPVPELSGAGQLVEKSESTRSVSATEKKYYSAVNLVSAEKYEEAIKEFKTILQNGDDEEYTSKAHYEIGRCLFLMTDYQTAIRVFTEMIQKFPKHPDVKDALFFIAKSHESTGNNEKAIALYKKLLAITSDTDTLKRKVAKNLRELEGR